MNKKSRISIRLTNNQELVLKEMSEALDTSISMLIRTIIGSWINEYENNIYNIIDKKKLEKDPNYKAPEENNTDIFEE